MPFPINVTKTYLPPLDEYVKYLRRIWDTGWVTNNGALVQELEIRLAEFLQVPFVQYVANGTVALQIALKALDIKGEVITTPFSYVATTNSLLWEDCKPVFVDIDPASMGIDPAKIEASITKRTSAIMAVHVYGYPCDVAAIEQIARRHGLKVIYDGAHAFGCKLLDNSLLNYGDLSTLSFHATKLFHTVEGGAIIAHTTEMAQKISLLKSFGHRGDDYHMVGINAKNTELHAAMGLCLLPMVTELIEKRRTVTKWYHELLNELDLIIPSPPKEIQYNYSYLPVLLRSEEVLLRVMDRLKTNSVFPRRYFYPPLNTLSFVNGESCPIAEDISRRVLCLPMYSELEEADVKQICSHVRSGLLA